MQSLPSPELSASDHLQQVPRREQSGHPAHARGAHPRKAQVDLARPGEAQRGRAQVVGAHARELLARLAARCDLLIENFRPGVLAKYGLDDPSKIASISNDPAKMAELQTASAAMSDPAVQKASDNIEKWINARCPGLSGTTK